MMSDETTAHTDLRPATPNPVPARLAAFVGEWRWEAFVGGQSVFDWLEGGRFLVEHADAEQAGFPAGTAIICGDDTAETYSRICQMSLSEGVWKLWRDAPGFSRRFIR